MKKLLPLLYISFRILKLVTCKSIMYPENFQLKLWIDGSEKESRDYIHKYAMCIVLSHSKRVGHQILFLWITPFTSRYFSLLFLSYAILFIFVSSIWPTNIYYNIHLLVLFDFIVIALHPMWRGTRFQIILIFKFSL